MPNPLSDPVVLTGCGWVTPFAAGTIDDVLSAAESNPKQVRDPDGFWAVPDELLKTYTGLSTELKRNPGALLAGVAVEHALNSSGLDREKIDGRRCGMVLGCALAGQLGMIGFANEVRGQTPRFVSPIHFPQTVGNYISGALARGFDIRGPNITLSSGAASGLDALIEGKSAIESGTADVVLAGGIDRLSPELCKGLAKPGTRLSEGACMFVLERASAAKQRSQPPLATLTGAQRHASHNAASEDANMELISEAGMSQDGAICIEQWIGHCFGALGAAAVAAAIAAANGAEVPTHGGNKVSFSAARGGDDRTVARALATADDGHCAVIKLSVG